MAEKLCVFCDHLNFGIYGYTDSYEGDVVGGGQIKCGKGHWCMERSKYDMPDFERDPGITFTKGELAEAIQKAKTCPDYSPPSQGLSE